ncbi:MAG: hypothetical protein MZV49_08585 [Rhodopseudomonas palustris]|nr:hypothetical protein [Rhodopseudomonas palustris]
MARLEPVTVGGVVVHERHAAQRGLHRGHGGDGSRSRRPDIRVGDTVIVQRAGDVIPQVVDVVLDKRPADAEPYRFPDSTARSAAATRCARNRRGGPRAAPARLICPAQAVERLKHFVVARSRSTSTGSAKSRSSAVP